MMIREIYETDEFKKFFNSLTDSGKKKVDYVLNRVMNEKVVSTKFIKHITNTYLYELRISIGNEYRVFIFTIDSDDFVNATQILLLNGFLKKGTKDYKKEIKKAIKIITKWSDQS